MLAGGLAHDFNNVLGGIIAIVSLIDYRLKQNRGIDNDKLREYVDMMKESGTRAADMVQQLLALSRKQNLNLTSVDLNHSIKHIMNICKNTFEKSVTLRPEYYKEPVMVRADPTHIEQALLNICVNAAHAMTLMRKEGETWGGTLSVTIDRISADRHFVATHPEAVMADYWVISVMDNGVGMTVDIISKIFNPFFSTKEKGRGTGLGLSMVYNLITQHKGFIDVFSEPAVGSTFNLYLPVLVEGDEIVPGSSGPAIKRGEGLVLVVDDEEVMRQTAREILTECGYDVITASNGRQGFDVFRERYNDIRAVILDMAMPEMSGKDTYIKMKEIDPFCRVIITSGFKQDERVEEALGLGAQGFMQKPYTLDKLSELLHDLLKD